MNDKPVMVITGAAKNTGFAIARRFAKEGYDVCITSRCPEDAHKAADKIMNEYPWSFVAGYMLIPSDVADIRKVFTEIKERFGRIDVMIANATATGFNQNILNSTPEDYDFIMNSNTRAYFFCCQEAAKIMVENKKGSIILIGSVHSKRPMPNRILYGLSKTAIDGLHKAIAYELGKYNIRCNCLIAGAIYKKERWDSMTAEQLDAWRGEWPLGIESTPDDIANAAYFLGSDQSATITGTDLVVDSGVTACLVKYDKNWEENTKSKK